MPAPLPDKLPDVSGRGSIARGFRMAFSAINQLIDAVRSLTPRSPGTGYYSHTRTGTTYKSGGAGDVQEEDSDAGRWA